jgi:4-amino-4-deoxy-L-arabinose transferase-like glycosyltransferase
VRPPVLTLLLLSFVTFGIGLGQQAITEADEAYYAEAAREMVVSGDWITPHFNFEDRWQKPVLYYWLTALTYLVTGPGEGAARAWSALSGAGLVLLAWVMASRGASTRPHAWLAGAITATCFGYFAMARSALPDLPLAFCITLTITAVLAAFDGRGRDSLRWWVLAGVAIGLGCLMKGPIAVVVPALALAPAWWVERKEASVRWSHVAVGAAVAALVAMPWYAAMVSRHGSAYIDSFLVGDNLERFTTTRFNEERPLWFYLPVIAGGLLPWAAFGIVAAVPGIVELARRRWRPTRDDVRLLSWAIVPTLFFVVSVGQQPRYVLPVLPPLAILAARAIGERIEQAARGQRARGLAVATWATAAFFVLSAALVYRLQPLLTETSPVVLTTSALGMAASAAALAIVAVRGAWTSLPLATTAAAIALLLGVQFSVFAPRRPSAVEQMAAFVAAHRPNAEPIGTYRAFTRNLVFYTRTKQVDLFDPAGAAQFLAAQTRVLLVLPERDLTSIAAAAHIEPRTLARVRHLNTANLRLRSLLNPDPAIELETVVLVSNR